MITTNQKLEKGGEEKKKSQELSYLIFCSLHQSGFSANHEGLPGSQGLLFFREKKKKKKNDNTSILEFFGGTGSCAVSFLYKCRKPLKLPT